MTMTQVPTRAAQRAPHLFLTRPKPLQRDVTRLNASPRCGARTRRGDPCRAPAVGGRARCRMHGGARGSGGQPGNRNAWRHGLYDRHAKAENRRHQALLRYARSLLRLVAAERRRILGRQTPRTTNPGVHGLVCQVSPCKPLCPASSLVPAGQRPAVTRHRRSATGLQLDAGAAGRPTLPLLSSCPACRPRPAARMGRARGAASCDTDRSLKEQA